MDFHTYFFEGNFFSFFVLSMRDQKRFWEAYKEREMLEKCIIHLDTRARLVARHRRVFGPYIWNVPVDLSSTR